MATQCQGHNRTGEPCSAHVDAGNTWCRWHDPARAADRRAWSEKGGRNRSNRARARKRLAGQVLTITDIDAVLCSALTDVSTGKLEPAIGSSMAGIARTIVAIRAAADLEHRLSALEKRADAQEKGWIA